MIKLKLVDKTFINFTSDGLRQEEGCKMFGSPEELQENSG